MMKFLFGQHFWIFIVTFLMSASYLSAQSINHLLRLSIKPQVAAPLLGKDDTDMMIARNRKDARVILKNANFFDPDGAPVTTQEKKKEKKEEKPKPKKKSAFGCPPVEINKEYKTTKMRNLALKGTSISKANELYSLAAVYLTVKNPKPQYMEKKRWRKTSRRVEMFRIGDPLSDTAKLCAIGRKKIVLLNKGKLEQISLERPPKKTPKMRLFGALGGEGEEEKFQADRVDSRKLKRKVVQDWLANPMQHAMSARVMPHYEGGRSAGFRLVWIKKGSLYSKMGLKSGDVVQQINDKKLSVGTALGLMSQLPYAKNLRVNLIRNGVKQTINFNIK